MINNNKEVKISKEKNGNNELRSEEAEENIFSSKILFNNGNGNNEDITTVENL